MVRSIPARFVLLCVAVAAVSVGQAAEEAPKKVTYEDDVKPIFRQYCLNCHQQSDKKGGLALDTFGSVVEGGGSGEVVYDDGDAESSRLWQLVNHDDTPVMPPNQDKLPADKLAVIRAWIEGGILENSGSKAKAKKKNALAFVASSSGKPEGPVAMPETLPLETPVVTSRAAAVTAIAASPWAPVVAVAGQKQIVMYHSDTAELLGILPFPEGVPQDIRFNRDGSYLIVGGGEHSVLGIVAIYDVKTGERVATVGDELDIVFGADANETLSRVAMGGPQKMLRIFDVGSGDKLFDIKKHTDWIFSVAYSPDGVLLASGDRSGGLVVWEAETGREYMDLTGHKGGINSIAWRDDSNVLASASEDGTVKLWDMNSGKAIKTINAHGGGVTAVSFDHQARLATAGRDNRAKLWDATGKELKSLSHGGEDMLEVAITHDGKRLVYGDWAGSVFNTPVDDPDAMVRLAANPEPAAKRVEAVKTTLVSIQEKLTPAKANLDKANAAVAAAQTSLADLDQKVAMLNKQAADSDAQAKKTEQANAAFDQQLPSLTNAIRDLQDEVTALRVALKSDASKMIPLAESEEKLAGKLTDLAKQRRNRVAMIDVIKTHRQTAAARKAEAEKLAAGRAALQTKLDQAQSLAQAAKQAHDEIAAAASKVQSKMDRLLAEIK
ncbi:c-type cytochrome domain-containing protein [Rhodopirellula sp. JC639]|uniref:c-type cytochrome domain-containing protein n=1 Tax=Stieleria mannarensis TaxID=2755585 RepID=UPI001602F5E1|nr:c-type cytochrome domain-containing protein [Rhodopirellula sp. JC639]